MKTLVVLPQKARWMDEIRRNLSVFSDVNFLTLESITWAPEQYSKDSLDIAIGEICSIAKEFDLVIFNFEFFEILLDDFWVPLIVAVGRSSKTALWFFDSYRGREVTLSAIEVVNPDYCFFASFSDHLWFSSYYVNSFFVPLEGSYEIYFPSNKLGAGVGFFGDPSKIGREDYLAEQTTKDMLTISPPGLSYDQIGEFIRSKSMIVNFSMVEKDSKGRLSRALKGRVLESGLCGRLVVSDYCAEIEALFGSVVPFFHNVDSFRGVLDDLMTNSVELRDRSAEFKFLCDRLRPSVVLANIFSRS